MRLITLTALIGFVSTMNLIGQHNLTVGEVYDYDVGDEFQFIRYWGDGASGPNNAHLFLVLEKRFSNSQDTVFYTMRNSGYNPLYWDEEANMWVNSFYDNIVYEMYTRLDQPVHPIDYSGDTLPVIPMIPCQF